MLTRLRHLFRDFAGLFTDDPERRPSVELLETEKENIRALIAKYNQALASHADACERLMARGREIEENERDLHARTVEHLRAGNREAAGACALRLQDVQRKLEEHRRQLEEAGTAYRELIRTRESVVRVAQAKIEALRLGLDDLKVCQSTAEIAELAKGAASQIGDGGTLDRLTHMVNEERYRAMGRARVAQDLLENADLAFKQYEEKALADQALIDFAAREGLSLEDGKNDDESQRPL